MTETPYGEYGQTNTVVDVDRFLEFHDKCTLGKDPTADGKQGYFSDTSGMIGVLGNVFGDPNTCTMLFDDNGDLVVMETAEAIPTTNNIPVILGRSNPAIAGRYVSNIHASVTHRDGKFFINDNDSTNGTVLFKAQEVDIDSTDDDLTARVVVLPEIPIRAFIGLGDSAVISLAQFPDGSISITDALNKGAQRLALIRNNEVITIGNHGPVPQDMIGQHYGISGEIVEPAHIRIMNRNGKLYLINLAQKPFSVAADRNVRPKTPNAGPNQYTGEYAGRDGSKQSGPQPNNQGNEQGHQPPPNGKSSRDAGPDASNQQRSNKAGPRPQQSAQQKPRAKASPPPKPDFVEGHLPQKKMTTSRLWQQMEVFVNRELVAARLEAESKGEPFDPRKLYRKFARLYHPDLNPDNENAHRAMQLINRLLN